MHDCFECDAPITFASISLMKGPNNCIMKKFCRKNNLVSIKKMSAASDDDDYGDDYEDDYSEDSDQEKVFKFESPILFVINQTLTYLPSCNSC